MNKAEFNNLLMNNYVHTLIIEDHENNKSHVLELQDLQIKKVEDGFIVLFHKKIRGDKIGTSGRV